MDNRTVDLSSGNVTNGTVVDNIAHWGAIPVINVIFAVLAISFNGVILLIFARDRKLWTSFNVYLINLLLSNFIYYIIESPFGIVNCLYPVWWLGKDICTLFMYGLWVVSLVQFCTHPLIAINRVWALWMPVSYRRFHHNRIAWKFCSLTWIIAHIVALPGVIADHLYYRKPEETHGCFVDTTAIPIQKAWMLIVQFISIITEGAVLLSFPLIWYKEKTRKKIGVQVTGLEKPGDFQSTVTNMAAVKEPISIEEGKVMDRVTSQGRPSQTPAATATNKTRSVTQAKRRSHSFLLLTLLTISVLIFWSPSVFYFTVQPFYDFSYPIFESVIMMLFNAQAVVDPLLFALTLKPLRNAIALMFRFRKASR